MEERKKTIVLALFCCILIIIACLIVGAIYFTQKNNAQKEKLKNEQAAKDIAITLDTLLNRTKAEDIYISGLYFNNSSYNLFSEGEAGATIANLIEYKIEEIDLAQDNGSIKINITSPDIYKILVEIVEKDNSFDNTDALLKSLAEKLTTTYPSINNSVVCSIEYKNEHWYIKSNKELFNSLSGNLYNYYIDLGKSTIVEILGGNSDG